MSEKIFTKGLIVRPPRAGAPAFIKGAIAINASEFRSFMDEHTKTDGWINIDILESKDGTKWYGQLDTWEKGTPTDGGSEPTKEIEPEDIPF